MAVTTASSWPTVNGAILLLETSDEYRLRVVQ